MKIPKDAIIPEAKLTRYLLVWRPKKDKSKFLAKAGFTLDHPDDLELAIRQIIETNEAVLDRSNEFGDYYRVDGDLIGINGRILGVVTIWILKSATDGNFQFVTLKPRKEKK